MQLDADSDIKAAHHTSPEDEDKGKVPTFPRLPHFSTACALPSCRKQHAETMHAALCHVEGLSIVPLSPPSKEPVGGLAERGMTDVPSTGD